MVRVAQTRTGADGNCLNACMASILEIPLKDVPEFGDDWMGDLNEFLSTRGLSYRRVPMYKKPSGYSTIEGVSPRGGLHACVALDGELIWDPHPIEDGTGQGLVEPRYYGLLEPLLGVTGKELKQQKSKGLDGKKFNPAAWHAGNATADSITLFKDVAIGDYFLWRFGPDVLTLKKTGKQQGEHLDGMKQWVSLNYLTRKVAKPTKRGQDRADMLKLRSNTEKQGGPFFVQETMKSGKTHTIPVRNLSKT